MPRKKFIKSVNLLLDTHRCSGKLIHLIGGFQKAEEKFIKSVNLLLDTHRWSEKLIHLIGGFQYAEEKIYQIRKFVFRH